MNLSLKSILRTVCPYLILIIGCFFIKFGFGASSVIISDIWFVLAFFVFSPSYGYWKDKCLVWFGDK